MAAYWRYHLMGLSIFCFLWQSHCGVPLEDGDIICHSGMPDSNADTNNYIWLGVEDVKTKAKRIPEKALKDYLADIPRFYQHRSTVVSDLDPKNAMEHNYINIKKEFSIIRRQYDHIPLKHKIDQLSKNIDKMEEFQEILFMGIQDTPYWMKGKAGRDRFVVITGLNQNDNSAKNEILWDLAGEINQRFWYSHIKDLYIILHSLVSLKRNLHQNNSYFTANITVINRLQKVIMQTVGYMYHQKIIPEESLRNFLKLENTLDLAAFSRVFYPDWEGQEKYEGHVYPKKIPILNQWHSKNDRNSYTEILDERNKRYLSYLYLKEFKNQSMNLWKTDTISSTFESMFEDDKLFYTLENQKYSEIRFMIQELIVEFQRTQSDKAANRVREAVFFVLDFLQANYDLDIMKIDKGDKFEEKLRLMSTSFQLQKEFQNILWYLVHQNKNQDNIILHEKNQNKINGFGEEVLMIYKYYNLLISKHDEMCDNPEMHPYCQASQLGPLKEYIQYLITCKIESNRYYFLSDSNHRKQKGQKILQWIYRRLALK